MSPESSAVLHHTCFVVPDLTATAQSLSDSLGIGPWQVFTVEPTELTVRGEESASSFRIAFAEVGGTAYELLEPGAGDSLYSEFLEANGPGFHHTCLAYPTLEDMRQQKSELLAQGREAVMTASVGDAVELAYFMIPEVGSIVELLYIGEMPPPDSTIG